VTRLPVVGFRTMNAVLLRLGFEVVRQIREIELTPEKFADELLEL
jgi:hypothetical protein